MVESRSETTALEYVPQHGLGLTVTAECLRYGRFLGTVAWRKSSRTCGAGLPGDAGPRDVLSGCASGKSVSVSGARL